MKKIAVLCSGGVDSSSVLSLLKKNAEIEITVFYLKIWLEDELHYLGDCPWEEDLSIVRDTCRLLSVPLEVISLQKEYWRKVVEKSISMIKSGYTPNPDIFCNSTIKFGSFVETCCSSFDQIATGHYAKKTNVNNWSYLYMGNDKKKDQTYFLSHTPYENLQKVIFPIEAFKNKQELRIYALEEKLPAALRKDSQGICFLGKISFFDFVKHHCGVKKGLFLDYETHAVLGTHEGFWFFTVGQRQGIGLSGGPYYVIKKDIYENIIYISRKRPSELFIENIDITLSCFNYLVPKEEYLTINSIYAIKIRHGEVLNQAIVLSIDQNKIKIRLKFPDQGIAFGQFIAFYTAGDKCIGSGMIEQI